MSLPPGTRVRVLRGDPIPEQLAALIVALDQTAPEATPNVTAASPAPRAWRRAARLESLGGAPLTSANDPRLQRSPP